MERVILGATGLAVSRIGYGAFKIGRNEKIKYPAEFDLPSERDVDRLIRGVYDLGINYFDTAAAYGRSERLLGRTLPSLGEDIVVSTKAGEEFERGESRYDFSRAALTASVERSIRRLCREPLDLVFLHSSRDDLRVLRETDAVETLVDLKQRGLVRHIGFSGYTDAGFRESLAWAEAVMIEYHLDDRRLAPVIDECARRGVGVVVKKGLGAGRLAPVDAIPFVLSNHAVHSLVIASLKIENIASNVRLA